MSSLLKNLVFALALAVILWLGYNLFLKDDEPLLESTSGGVSNAVIQDREILALLDELDQLKLDGSIFDDPRFTSLTNHRQDLGIEASGREDPFAPVE